MSGITLDDIAKENVIDAEFSEVEETGAYEVEQPSRMSGFLDKVIHAETGPGSIGDYLEHPMNFNQSKGLARILRGLTGIIGNLSLAIIDVALGALEFSKEQKGAVVHDISSRSGFPS